MKKKFLHSAFAEAVENTANRTKSEQWRKFMIPVISVV